MIDLSFSWTYILAMFIICNCNCAVLTLSSIISSVFFCISRSKYGNLKLLSSEDYIVVCFLEITQLRCYVLHDLYL